MAKLKRKSSHLNSRPSLLFQQNVLRLQVTVNDLESIERLETLKQRMSKLSNELETESLEFVLLDQLVEVDVEQFKDYAHVIAEYKVVEPGVTGERICVSTRKSDVV